MRYFNAQIKERKPGKDWRPLCFWVIGRTWQDCQREFIKWIMGWLDDVNNDHASEVLEQLKKDYIAGEYADRFDYDGTAYSIRSLKALEVLR